jgi:hypothetical protein
MSFEGMKGWKRKRGKCEWKRRKMKHKEEMEGKKVK